MHDSRTHALCEAYWKEGRSGYQIHKLTGVAVDTILKWAKKDNWPKNGCNRKKLEEIETQSLFEAAAKHGITKERIFEEQAKILNVDMADLYEIIEGGELTLKTFEKMNKAMPGTSSIIKKIKEKRRIQESQDGSGIILNQDIELELYDKQKAIEQCMKALRMFKDEGEDDKDVNVYNLINHIQEREQHGSDD